MANKKISELEFHNEAPATDDYLPMVDQSVLGTRKVTVEKLSGGLTGLTTAQLAASSVVTESEGISSNDNDDTLPTSAAVRDYVDTNITAQDLDFQGDSGGALSIDLDSESLTIAGGTGITTGGSSNTLTVNIDSTVATLGGTQTLTNKTLTDALANTQSLSDNSTKVATTAYVDGMILAAGGDISSVVAGTNLNGGGTVGDVTLNLDTTLTGLSSVATASLSLNGTAVTASATQLNYVDATSSIQTQLDANKIRANHTGDLSLGDNEKIYLGDSNDLAIYHDGNTSLAVDAGTGGVRISTDAFELRNAASDESMITATEDASVTLHCDGNQKLSTAAGGINVTGDIVVSGTVDGRDVATDGTKLDGIAANAGVGDIESVTAGANLNGGGTTGDVTLNLDTSLTGLSSVATTSLSLGGTAITASATQLNYVDATSSIQTQIDNSGTVNTGADGYLAYYDGAGKAVNDASGLYWDDVNSRLGIGTASPSRLLHLSSSGGTFVRLDTGEGDDFSVGANSNGWSVYNETDSSYSLVVDGSGNCGLGTTAPSVKLDCRGNANLEAANANLTINATSSYPYINMEENGTVRFQQAYDVTNNEFYFTAVESGSDIWFGTANTERMRIDSSGDVSLKTQGAKLSLLEDGSTAYMSIKNAAGPKLQVLNSTDGVIATFENSSGNLGIATSVPSAKLHVAGDALLADGKILVTNTGGNTGAVYNGSDATGDVRISGGNSATNGAGIVFYGGSHSATPDVTLFQTGSTERFRIASSGQLGIGGANYGTSGQVLTSNGSGSAPSWQTPSGGGSGDVSKVGTPASGQVGYWTGDGTLAGENNLFWDSSNDRLGIGNTVPSYKLDVSGTMFTGADDQGINIHGSTTGVAMVAAVNRANNAYKKMAFNASEYDWLVSGTSKVGINSSGQMGIGGVATDGPLHIFNAHSGAQRTVTIENTAGGDASIQYEATGGSVWASGLDNSDSDKFKISQNELGDVDRFTIDTSGVATITNSNSGLVIKNSGESDKEWRVGGGSSGKFQITEVGVADRLTVLAGGNCGIATASPSAKLHVAGDALLADGKLLATNTSGDTGAIYNGSAATGDVRISGGNSSTNGAGIVLYGGSHSATPNVAIFNTGSTERFRIGSSGELGIGGANYGTSGQVLTSSGNGSAVTWSDVSSGGGGGEGGGGDPSDSRLKENVKEIKALDKVNRLRPVEFDWNELATEETGEEGHSFGLIAQEVEEIYPHLIKEKDSGFKNLNYRMLTPLLVQSVKELSEENKSLRNRLDAIEQKVQSL